MRYQTAKFWADVLNDLFAGKEYIATNCYEYRGWEPEVSIEKFETAFSYKYEHNPEDGFFHWNDSYGNTGGLDHIEIDTRRAAVIMRGQTPDNKGCWRSLTLINPTNEDMFKLRRYQKEGWKQK